MRAVHAVHAAPPPRRRTSSSCPSSRARTRRPYARTLGATGLGGAGERALSRLWAGGIWAGGRLGVGPLVSSLLPLLGWNRRQGGQQRRRAGRASVSAPLGACWALALLPSGALAPATTGAPLLPHPAAGTSRRTRPLSTASSTAWCAVPAAPAVLRLLCLCCGRRSRWQKAWHACSHWGLLWPQTSPARWAHVTASVGYSPGTLQAKEGGAPPPPPIH